MKRRQVIAIDWDTQPLGKMSDHELARRLSVKHDRVTRARRSRGIRPYDRYEKLRYWLKTHEGQFTDACVAAKFSLTTDTVCSVRRTMGIRAKYPGEVAPKALRESILRVLRDAAEGLQSHDVTIGVRDDFGRVSHRNVQRQLQVLVKRGKVIRSGENTATRYVRRGK